MKKFILVLFSLGILTIFVYVGLFLYQKSKADPIVYKTESPFVTDIVKKTIATGSIEPRKEVLIKSQVPGIVEKVYVNPGDLVKAGQVLAKIRIIPNMVSLNNAESTLRKAQISQQEVKKDMERQEKLYQNQLISEKEYNQYVMEYKLKTEELEAAENNLQLIQEGASKKSGQISNIVKSTVSGMVLDVPVKEGSHIIQSNDFNEGTTIASIADMSSIIFKGKVDESEVGKIKPGMALDVKIGALEGETFKANLEYISPKGIDDKGAIKFEVKASLLLKENTLIRAGYSANADIILDRRDQVLAVRESNLQFNHGTPFVEVEVAPQVFEKKAVKVGLSDGINIEIVSGLKKEDKIKVVENWGLNQAKPSGK